MKISFTQFFRLSFFLAWLPLTGCLGLKPESDPTHYYSLSRLPIETDSHRDSQLSLGLRPVEIPDYLLRSSILIRRGEHELNPSTLHHWAEPIDNGIQNSMADGLSYHLQSASIRNRTWPQTLPPDYILDLNFHQFEATDDNRVILSVHWFLSHSIEGKEILSGREVIERPCPTNPPDYAQIVGALSECLNELSMRLAAQIKAVQ